MITAPQFFDARSESFDDEYRTNSSFAERLAVWGDLVERYGRAGEAALDVGCGGGMIATRASDLGMTVTCVDPSRKMLALAETRLPGAKLIEGTIEAISDHHLRARLVLCSSVLEYVVDLDRALSALARATERGGHLVVSLPNAAALYRHAEAIWFAATGLPSYRALVTHVTTPATLAARAARFGLAPVETRYYATPRPLRALDRVLPVHRRAAMFATVFVKRKPRLLCLVQLPPPVHGPAVVNEQVTRSAYLRDRLELATLPIRNTATLPELGRVSADKIGRALAVGRQLQRELVANPPDAVYFTLSPSGPAFYRDCAYTAILKARGVRRIYHLHGRGIAAASERPGMRALYRWVFAGADAICLSDSMRADLAGLVPANRIEVVANGVAEAHAAGPRSEAAVPRILFLSNMARSKGALVLVDALRMLAARGTAFTATFAGARTSDDTLEALEARICELGLADRVRYVGPATGTAKLELFCSHDIFALPTFHDAFPLVILEAMQQGLPVVSTREGCIPEIVVDGETGLLVARHDAAAFADRLDALLGTPELRRAMGVRGRERYEQHYTMTRFERELGRAIEACLDRA